MDKNTTFVPTDFRNIVPRFKQENLDANQVLVDLIRQVAASKNATPAQIALAWLLENGIRKHLKKEQDFN